VDADADALASRIDQAVQAEASLPGVLIRVNRGG
jgi:hypothetical protein